MSTGLSTGGLESCTEMRCFSTCCGSACGKPSGFRRDRMGGEEGDSLRTMEPEPDPKDWPGPWPRGCDDWAPWAGEIGRGGGAAGAGRPPGGWVKSLTATPAVNVRPGPGIWSALE